MVCKLEAAVGDLIVDNVVLRELVGLVVVEQDQVVLETQEQLTLAEAVVAVEDQELQYQVVLVDQE